MNATQYAVNGTTLLSILGMCFSPIAGFISIINSVVQFLLAVMFLVNGDSILHVVTTFFVATVFFIVAMLCKKSFSYSYWCLQQQQLPK